MSRPSASGSARLGVGTSYGTPTSDFDLRQRASTSASTSAAASLFSPVRSPLGNESRDDPRGKGKGKAKARAKWEVGTKGWVKEGFRRFGEHCARNQVRPTITWQSGETTKRWRTD